MPGLIGSVGEVLGHPILDLGPVVQIGQFLGVGHVGHRFFV